VQFAAFRLNKLFITSLHANIRIMLPTLLVSITEILFGAKVNLKNTVVLSVQQKRSQKIYKFSVDNAAEVCYIEFIK